MVLLGTEKIPRSHNKISAREAKSIHPFLSQSNVICSSYGEAAFGLATESFHFKYKPQECQELQGRLLVLKWLEKSDRRLNKGTLSFARLKYCRKAFGEVLTIVKAVSALFLVYCCVGWGLLLEVGRQIVLVTEFWICTRQGCLLP